MGFVSVDLLNEGDGVGCCFAGTVFSLRNYVAAGEDAGNGFFLDGARRFEAHFVDALSKRRG